MGAVTVRVVEQQSAPGSGCSSGTLFSMKLWESHLLRREEGLRVGTCGRWSSLEGPLSL